MLERPPDSGVAAVEGAIEVDKVGRCGDVFDREAKCVDVECLPHFDPHIVGKKIKSPAHLTAGTVRTLDTPTRDERGLTRALGAMGQELFEPPSVAGWDGGRAWINTSTLLLRQNTCTYLITGKDPGGRWKRSDMDYDPLALLEGLDQRTPQRVVDHLCDAMLGPHVSAERRAPLVRFLEERQTGVTADTVTGLLLLITAMPEYQLC